MNGSGLGPTNVVITRAVVDAPTKRLRQSSVLEQLGRASARRHPIHTLEAWFPIPFHPQVAVMRHPGALVGGSFGIAAGCSVPEMAGVARSV